MEKKPNISVDFCLTYNLGDFNSVKLGASLTDTITSTDEFDTKFDELYTKIRNKVFSEVKILNKQFKRTS